MVTVKRGGTSRRVPSTRPLALLPASSAGQAGQIFGFQCRIWWVKLLVVGRWCLARSKEEIANGDGSWYD